MADEKNPWGATTVLPVPLPVSATAFSVPAPATIQAARDGGAVAGTILAAPLAPKSGPITVGVASPVSATDSAPAREPLVVVAVRRFWDSSTVKYARSLLLGASTVFLLYLCGEVVAAGGVTGVAWHRVGVAGLNLATVSLATALVVRAHKNDNNVIGS